MTILDRPPSDWTRPSITLTAKVGAWENKHGPVDYDHRPALWERKFDTDKNDTIPAANDPKFIEPLARGRGSEHDVRTHGRGGEKRLTTLGSDSHRRAKARRIPEKFATVSEGPGGALAIPKPAPRKGAIQSKGFDRSRSRGMNGKVRPRKRRAT